MKYLQLKRRKLNSHEARRQCAPASNSKSVSLSSLPYEPLLEVLMNLDAKDILSVRLVRPRSNLLLSLRHHFVILISFVCCVLACLTG